MIFGLQPGSDIYNINKLWPDSLLLQQQTVTWQIEDATGKLETITERELTLAKPKCMAYCICVNKKYTEYNG